MGFLKFLNGSIELQIPLIQTGLKIRYHFTKFNGMGWGWGLTGKCSNRTKITALKKRAEKRASCFENPKLVNGMFVNI